MTLWALTATDDVLAHVAEQVSANGPGAGTRTLSVAPAGGLHARVLLDRGLDIGAAWYLGEPVAWLSAAGELPPGQADTGDGWNDRWAGGLLTTCGLQNVGVPSEGHGRHGRFSDLPAQDIAVSRELDEDGRGRIVVKARMHEPVELGRGIEVARSLSFDLGSGTVELEDVATNHSARSLQSPLLYHLNFGHPFLAPDSVVEQRNGDELVRMTAAAPMGQPALADDVVTEHPVVASADGTAAVSLASTALGMRATITWSVDTLPRLFTWQRRTPGSYVCAIEPANCSVWGRGFDRGEERAPFIEPRASRRTWLRIGLERLVS